MEIAGAISVSVVYDNWSTTRYYDFVAVTGIVIALLSIILNVLRVTERFESIPWNFIVRFYFIKWFRCVEIIFILLFKGTCYWRIMGLTYFDCCCYLHWLGSKIFQHGQLCRCSCKAILHCFNIIWVFS